MNLDDASLRARLDPQEMLLHIDGLPEQLAQAWEQGQGFPLARMEGVSSIVISGMGGSAIGGDLLASYTGKHLYVPLVVQRDYTLPAFAAGPGTWVIACSHSGNTEETLSAFEQARLSGCRILVITTGGALAEQANNHRVPLWQFEHRGQPRAAVGFSFGLLLSALTKAGLIENLGGEVKAAVAAMVAQREMIEAGVPVVRNPAKRLAGQMVGRHVTVFASDYLAPVARRWKTQIDELAKAWAQFEFLPEADHNTLAGVVHPENVLSQVMAVFLQSVSDHPRNQLRSDLTRKGLMQEGINTDFYRATGSTALEQMWTALHFGDYVSYYLAMAYGVDPTPVEALEGLKRAMRAQEGTG